MRANGKCGLRGDGGNADRESCLCRTVAALCIVLMTLAVALPTAAAPVYPLQKSANGRYLVDQNNLPYLIVGDSPQALIVKLSEAEAEAYFVDRAANGFNTVWINLLCETYTGGRPDGATFDGIPPFTGMLSSCTNLPDCYDLTTPNEAYFARVDQMLTLAAQQGLLVMLDPIETGGWLNTIVNNGSTNCRAYGQYLGNRYKNFDNIIWLNGNDDQDWIIASADAVVQQVALGIQDNDTRHIQTIELNFPTSGSLDDTNWAPIISLNASYTYYPTYAQVLFDYDRANFLPTFLVEANYEFVSDWIGNSTLRRQEYWSLLSGACGQLYGNGYTWQFTNNWQSYLDTAGSTQMEYVTALFAPLAWYNLVPDQNHTLVTAGYGTFASTGSVNDSDYVAAARTIDGTAAVVYMPTTRTITVDLSQLGNPVTAQWYDPSSGLYTTVPGSPFTNASPQALTPAGANADGDGDWVLVLDSASNTNVTIWEVSMAGRPRATCVLALAADSTVTGYGIEESQCGTFAVTGNWTQEPRGIISGVLTESFSDTNCQHATTVEGTFSTSPIRTARFGARESDSLGRLQWSAVRGPSFPVLASAWQGTLRIKRSKIQEIYNLTPGSSQPGWYNIQGQSADATYTLTGALIVTSRDQVTAWIVRQLPSGAVTSFYTGNVNLSRHTLDLTGTDATGARHQISAVPQ